MKSVARWFTHFTEGVAGLMMAAMFVTFILQIAVRYAARYGLVDASLFGWTLEFCLVMWLWIVFWGNAFIVREKDHVTFDILYLASPARLRAVFAIFGAAVIVVALLGSIEPTWSKLRILRLKSSATLPVKMLPIYSVYFLFLVVVPLRYLWRIVDVWRHGAGTEGHEHLDPIE